MSAGYRRPVRQRTDRSETLPCSEFCPFVLSCKDCQFKGGEAQ